MTDCPIKVGDTVRHRTCPTIGGTVVSIEPTGRVKQPWLVRYQTGTITIRGVTMGYCNVSAPDELVKVDP